MFAGLHRLTYSPVIQVDSTPPTPGAVQEQSDVYGAAKGDIDCQLSKTQVFATWSGWEDKESGIDHYELGLGTKPGSDDIKGFYSVGGGGVTETMVSELDVVLHGAEHVYVTIRGYNGVGMHSAASSNGVVIWQQGYPATLKDGLRIDEVDFVAETNEASVQWAFAAPCPIVKYEWAVLGFDNSVIQNFKTVCAKEITIITPGKPDVTKCLEPELERTFATNDGLKLQKGRGYYSLIRATDVFNNTRVAATDGFRILTDPPLPGAVFDGVANLVDLDFQGPTTFLGASWSGFGGETIAIADYYVSFGTNRRFPKLRADIVGVNRVERGKTSIRFDNLDLIPRGPKYYCTVVGEAGNKQRATTVSDGIAVGYGDPIIAGDIEAPAYQSDLNRLAVGFAAFRSSVDILYYEIAVGTRPLTPSIARNQQFDIMPFTCVCVEGQYLCPVKEGANNTCVDATYSGSGKMLFEDVQGVQYKWVEGAILTGVEGLGLKAGADYYLNIRATDRAYGALSVQSTRIRLDITPPLPGTVSVAGPGMDLHEIDSTKVMFVSHFNQIVVSWNGRDPESGVEAYDIAIVERDDCNASQVHVA